MTLCSSFDSSEYSVPVNLSLRKPDTRTAVAMAPGKESSFRLNNLAFDVSTMTCSCRKKRLKTFICSFSIPCNCLWFLRISQHWLLIYPATLWARVRTSGSNFRLKVSESCANAAEMISVLWQPSYRENPHSNTSYFVWIGCINLYLFQYSCFITFHICSLYMYVHEHNDRTIDKALPWCLSVVCNVWRPKVSA